MLDTMEEERAAEYMPELEDLPVSRETKTGDENAPYGYTSDGKPRAKPGRKPGQKNGTATRPPAPKKVVNRPAPPSAKTQTDYRPGLTALISDAIGSATLIGMHRNQMVVVADAAAVSNAVPAIVNLANTLGNQYIFAGAVLDRVLKFGQHAADTVMITAMIGQIMVNHKVIPPGLVPGTKPLDVLVSDFIERQMAESAEFAAVVHAMAAAGMGVQEPMKGDA